MTVTRVITVTMLFLQLVQYSSSFAGTPKNEIPGAALELCQLKIKQVSPEIRKFSTKHKDNPFTLNYLLFLASYCLYFMQARVDWVLIIFGTQVINKKQLVRPVFPDYLSVSYDYSVSYISQNTSVGIEFWLSQKCQELITIISRGLQDINQIAGGLNQQDLLLFNIFIERWLYMAPMIIVAYSVSKIINVKPKLFQFPTLCFMMVV